MSSCAYIAYRIGQHHAVVAARASSPAGIASMERTARRQKRVDFATGYCGLSPPTLFERIGIMAADGRPLPTRFHAAHHGCVTRLRHAQASRACPAHRQPVFGTGGEGRTACEDNTDQHRVRTGPTGRQPDRDEGRQEVHRAYQSCEDDTDSHRVRTWPSAFTGAARQPETDGGRQAVEQAHSHPPSRETWHERARWSVHLIGTASMTAIWR